jgi:hypothetical protein
MSNLHRAIAAVQTCRRQISGLDDDTTWRALLERVTGKRSLKEMTGRQLGSVLDELHRQGAPKKAGVGAGRSKLADDPQSKLIRRLWLLLGDAGQIDHRSEAAIAAFVGRTVDRDIQDLRWADVGEKRAAIEALKQWALRVGIDVDA